MNIHRQRNSGRGAAKRKVKPTKKRTLPEDKISLHDDWEIKADEKFWTVKMNIPGHSKKVERVLTAGPLELRLLVLETFEEVEKFPYKKLKEYSHNEAFKMFEITWYPSDKVEESYFFKTSKSKEIQAVVGNFIKEILKQQKGVDNPEMVLQRCTISKPAQVDRMKVGGRQRSAVVTRSRKEPKPKHPVREEKSVSIPQKRNKKKIDIIVPSQSTPSLRKPTSKNFIPLDSIALSSENESNSP